jgi:hypothetical protein
MAPPVTSGQRPCRRGRRQAAAQRGQPVVTGGGLVRATAAGLALQLHPGIEHGMEHIR